MDRVEVLEVVSLGGGDGGGGVYAERVEVLEVVSLGGGGGRSVQVGLT